MVCYPVQPGAGGDTLRTSNLCVSLPGGIIGSGGLHRLQVNLDRVAPDVVVYHYVINGRQVPAGTLVNQGKKLRVYVDFDIHEAVTFQTLSNSDKLSVPTDNQYIDGGLEEIAAGATVYQEDLNNDVLQVSNNAAGCNIVPYGWPVGAGGGLDVQNPTYVERGTYQVEGPAGHALRILWFGAVTSYEGTFPDHGDGRGTLDVDMLRPRPELGALAAAIPTPGAPVDFITDMGGAMWRHAHEQAPLSVLIQTSTQCYPIG